MPRPTSQDLAGFWDLLQLSIDDVTSKFDELQKIKSNDWRIIESPVKKVSSDWMLGYFKYLYISRKKNETFICKNRSIYTVDSC